MSQKSSLLQPTHQGQEAAVLVDTVGLLLHAVVHPADVQDRNGGILVMATLFGMYPFLQKLFADAGYQGPEFSTALAKVRPHLTVEIVKRSDRTNGFVVCQNAGSSNAACLAQSMSEARQGLGEPQSQSAGVLAPRLNPAHA